MRIWFVPITQRFYVGLSSPHLVNYDFNSTQRHYFLIAGPYLISMMISKSDPVLLLKPLEILQVL